MLPLTSVASVVGAFSTAGALRASAPVQLIRAAPTLDQHGAENRSPLPLRRRLAEPTMNMGMGSYGPGNGMAIGGYPGPGSSRSAADRAAARAQNGGRMPPQQFSAPQSYPPQFSAPMPRSRAAETLYAPPMADLHESAYVLIFNDGKDNEGVYTHSEQGGSDSLLAFECMHDALHFAEVLQTKGFDLATPLRWSGGRLATICERANLEMNRVPRDTMPEAPSERRQEDFEELDNRRAPEALRHEKSQADSYKYWLENLFSITPNCADVDCLLDPEDDEMQ